MDADLFITAQITLNQLEKKTDRDDEAGASSKKKKGMHNFVRL